MKLKKMSATEEQFVKSCAASIKNIIPCFSGRHSKCRQLQSVCLAHHDDYTPRHLPNNKHLKLSEKDNSKLETTISKTFSEGELNHVRCFFNTNLCESLHALVYNYAPKTSNYPKNFAGLCHSAVHTRSVGHGKATLELAEASGLLVRRHSAMRIGLRKRDELKKKNSARKATSKYKANRYHLRKKRTNRPLYTQSLYGVSNTGSASTTDHSYGLRS